jgi:plasmid stabilization system protein ParE
MVMKIYWTNFAKNELRKIFNHYKEKAGLKVAKNLVTGIVEKEASNSSANINFAKYGVKCTIS